MRYINLNELSGMIRNNLWKIPHDIDLVVGIPRSGLMVANMIALYLNKRLSDVDSFVEGRIFGYGTSRAQLISKKPIKKVLVVDDSIGLTGASLATAKKKLEPLTAIYEFSYFVPIVTTNGSTMVSAFAEIIDDTRIFEWNLFHHYLLEQACIDLDGVLCLDPPIDDDGEKYINYIENATPLFLPTATIGTIVTCRLEKYRQQTEKWLASHNIKYNHLLMLKMPSKAARVEWGRHGEFKAECLAKYGGSFFIESSLQQAEVIANISHRNVICIETNTMIPAGNNNSIKSIKKNIKKKHPKLFQFAKQVYHKLFNF